MVNEESAVAIPAAFSAFAGLTLKLTISRSVILSERGPERTGAPKSILLFGVGSGVVSEESAVAIPAAFSASAGLTLKLTISRSVILSERGPERTRGPKEQFRSLG